MVHSLYDFPSLCTPTHTHTLHTAHTHTGRSCLNTDSASALNEWTLRELINSVSPGTFKDAVVNTYYALTDFGGTVDDDSDPLHVLWPSTEQAVRPSKIWLNYAPYANSSRYLMQIYENSVNKPTIEIAGMYSVESVDMTIERLQCLAKLVSSGFKLIVWDTDTFRSKLQEHCQVLITQASNSDAFGKRIEVLERLVEFVKELSNNPDIGKWCPTTASRRAKLQNLRMWRN